MKKKLSLNDEDRRQWIANYEPLYRWQRFSQQPMTRFIREHRAEIDRIIYAELNRAPAR